MSKTTETQMRPKVLVVLEKGALAALVEALAETRVVDFVGLVAVVLVLALVMRVGQFPLVLLWPAIAPHLTLETA
eukprot:48686-Karenia_brevis.AAC.1